jgi:hypothetical protein
MVLIVATLPADARWNIAAWPYVTIGRMLLEGTAAVRRAHDERMSGDQAEVTAA